MTLGDDYTILLIVANLKAYSFGETINTDYPLII